MLTSTVVRLRALERGELPNTVGQFGHAAFLRLIETVAPDLAQHLHDHNGRQPFTVSPLRVTERARLDGQITLREGESCSMRFTILDPALFDSFQTAFLAQSFAASIELQHIPFAVEEVITTGRAEGWTGFTSFAELWEGGSAEPLIALRFHTPTALSLGDAGTGKRFELLPVAWRVFDSLCRKWNEFAERPLCEPLELWEWAADNVLVSEVRQLNTEMLRFTRMAQKGFTGSVVYEARTDDAEKLRALNALADFALYAGVGYRTTWGMGQVRRLRA